MKILKTTLLLLLTNVALGQCISTAKTDGSITIVLRQDGSLWGWGSNSTCNLGLGLETQGIIFPLSRIGTDNDWSTNYDVNRHTLAIKNDGSLWAWGMNFSGQCGDGSFGDQNFVSSPRLVSNESWMTVAAGFDYSLGIKTDGTLWAWGSNTKGQLGNGSVETLPQLSPLKIGVDSDWVKVFSHRSTSYGIKSNGTLWSWGNGYQPVLGYIGTAIERRSPHQIGYSAWKSVSPHYTTVMAVKNDGTLWVWGANTDNSFTAYYGNGIEDPNDYANNPTQIGNDTDWQSVSTGQYEFKALKTDGTIWGWGQNYAGRVGDGTTTPKYVPVQIGTDSDWISVDSSNINALAIKTDQKLYDWGYTFAFPAPIVTTTPTLNDAPCTILATKDLASSYIMRAFPNPTNGKTKIGFGRAISGTVRISDMLGQTLAQNTLADQEEATVDLSNLDSGIYLITIQNGSKSQTVKISKQ